MAIRQRILMAGGTFACALGIGFVTQNGDALAARFSGEREPAPAAQPATEAIVIQTAGMAPMAPPATPSGPETPLPSSSAAVSLPAPPATLANPVMPGIGTGTDPEAELVLTSAPADGDAPADAPLLSEPLANDTCAPLLLAETAPAAMVRITLDAACQPNERVTLHHNGMMFSAVTDASGQLDLMVPALNETAVFIASLASGTDAMVVTEVPTLKFYDRVALQWQAEDGFELHAREFGADYGEPGHIWHAAARELADVADGRGGFLMRLGDAAAPEALLAEVYTFPTAAMDRPGDVVLSVEAEVTATNCGRAVAAQSLQVQRDAQVFVQELTMEMPGCEAAGDFLVLKNMLEDLTIAQK